MGRLVMSVKERGESVVIDLGSGEEIEVQVSKLKGKRVELAVNAPRRCKISRQDRSSASRTEGDSAK